MPELYGCGHVVELLLEAGTVSYEGALCHPLTWQEIESWLNCTQLELSNWTITTIRHMSQAYALEHNMGRDEYRPAPSAPVKTEEKQKQSMDALKAGLRSFMSMKTKGR